MELNSWRRRCRGSRAGDLGRGLYILQSSSSTTIRLFSFLFSLYYIPSLSIYSRAGNCVVLPGLSSIEYNPDQVPADPPLIVRSKINRLARYPRFFHTGNQHTIIYGVVFNRDQTQCSYPEMMAKKSSIGHVANREAVSSGSSLTYSLIKTSHQDTLNWKLITTGIGSCFEPTLIKFCNQTGIKQIPIILQSIAWHSTEDAHKQVNWMLQLLSIDFPVNRQTSRNKMN